MAERQEQKFGQGYAGWSTSVEPERTPPTSPEPSRSGGLKSVVDSGRKIVDDLAPIVLEKAREHPGFVESAIPFWGSAREAVADGLEGDVVGALANGALAVTDVGLGGYLGKQALKGALVQSMKAPRGKVTRYAWERVSREMRKNELLAKGQPGHHWAIPQKGWGANVPEKIKNQPWNIHGMPNAEVHGRVHGRYKGQERYKLPERIWRSTPGWAKVGAGDAAGHAATGIRAGMTNDED